MKYFKIYLLFSFLTVSMSVNAYIGPGLGLGTIATVLGIFFGLCLMLIGIIWYPLKKLYKRLRK